MPALFRRLGLILLVIAAATTCLLLGWWQWGRFDSNSGTAQNLGYALQWPLFAGFVVYAFFRFLRLERQARVEEDGEPRPVATRTAAPTELPAGLLPERPAARVEEADRVVTEYNRQLAALHGRRLPSADDARRAG
ncbi:transcriptional regulator [Nocardia stercoris]|uniref:Transcriptional regulator n=1 Tax=Nocardia stercoris TaxID=2483361 RepID=A0A3M2L8F9_9NOCA|nr:transcriptional regulator [Nocardia stercoris]RMI32970.1 transcriptional regulator [Nocardia stercoris]